MSFSQACAICLAALMHLSVMAEEVKPDIHDRAYLETLDDVALMLLKSDSPTALAVSVNVKHIETAVGFN